MSVHHYEKRLPQEGTSMETRLRAIWSLPGMQWGMSWSFLMLLAWMAVLYLPFNVFVDAATTLCCGQGPSSETLQDVPHVAHPELGFVLLLQPSWTESSCFFRAYGFLCSGSISLSGQPCITSRSTCDNTGSRSVHW